MKRGEFIISVISVLKKIPLVTGIFLLLDLATAFAAGGAASTALPAAGSFHLASSRFIQPFLTSALNKTLGYFLAESIVSLAVLQTLALFTTRVRVFNWAYRWAAVGYIVAAVAVPMTFMVWTPLTEILLAQSVLAKCAVASIFLKEMRLEQTQESVGRVLARWLLIGAAIFVAALVVIRLVWQN